jgi:UPF0755 protein
MRRIIALFLIISLFVLFCLVFIPARAAHLYGPPARSLSPLQIVQYSVKLLWYDGIITSPYSANSTEQYFVVGNAEQVISFASHLETSGLIRDRLAFRDYLVYTGLDTSIQAGTYSLSPAMSIVDIAHEMQDATPHEVTFVILPGWRMEEIAASLPTSGLDVTPEQFLEAARKPGQLDFAQDMTSNEGFLFPDTYILPRDTNAEQLMVTFVRNFALHLSLSLRAGFADQGLDVYAAVTLASLVEREAIHEEEKPLIASVFLNRLNAGIKLDSDPTVQYALGFNPTQQTWWTNPLSAADLQIDSPYNTYLHPGLPPTPISNPGLSALQAVAFPAQTSYFYFRARCDGSAFHVFAETFEEHLQNACP